MDGLDPAGGPEQRDHECFDFRKNYASIKGS
jgi:hypothetical protein